MQGSANDVWALVHHQQQAIIFLQRKLDETISEVNRLSERVTSLCSSFSSFTSTYNSHYHNNYGSYYNPSQSGTATSANPGTHNQVTISRPVEF